MRYKFILTAFLIFISFIIYLVSASSDLPYAGKVVNEQRQSCSLYFPLTVCYLLYSKASYFINLYFQRYFIALSLNYLLLENHPLLLFEVPLIISGIYYLYKKNRKILLYVGYFLLIYPLLGPVYNLDFYSNHLISNLILILLEILGSWQIMRSLINKSVFKKRPDGTKSI